MRGGSQSAWTRLRSITTLAGALLVAVVLVLLLGGESLAPAGAATGALAAGAALAFGRQLRRPLIALLFFLAPFDISKAFVAPLASTFYAAGPYYSPGLYVTLAEMVALALFVFWAGHRLLVERRGLPLTRLDLLSLAYLAWIWVRAFAAEQGGLALATAAGYSLAVLCFYIVSHVLVDRDDMRVALRAALCGLAFEIVYVTAQAVSGSLLALPGSKAIALGSLVELGGGQAFRPPGSFNHPNALAHFLVVLLPPLLALLMLGRERISARTRAVALTGLVGGFGVLLLTLSRGGWAAFAVAALSVVAVYWRRGLVSNRQLGWGVVSTLFAGAMLVAARPNLLLRLTEPDGRSLESRGLLADMAWTIIQANPWVGVGYGDYNRAAFRYIAPAWANVSSDYQFSLHQLVVHNHFLLIAAEIGLPAMLFFAYLLWRFVRQPMPLSRWQDPSRFALAVGLAGSLIGQAFFLNSDNYYVDPRIFLLWMSAGVLQALCLQAPVQVREVRDARSGRRMTP